MPWVARKRSCQPAPGAKLDPLPWRRLGRGGVAERRERGDRTACHGEGVLRVERGDLGDETSDNALRLVGDLIEPVEEEVEAVVTQRRRADVYGGPVG